MTDTDTSAVPEPLRTRAKSLLSDYVRRASEETSVLADYQKRQHLLELGARLERCLACAEGYPNPAYNGLAEAVARCLVLYEDAPDLYAQLVRGICVDESEVFLDTFEGILRLDVLVAGLADDHDYVFNDVSGTIERACFATGRFHGLVPAHFLVLLEETWHREND